MTEYCIVDPIGGSIKALSYALIMAKLGERGAFLIAREQNSCRQMGTFDSLFEVVGATDDFCPRIICTDDSHNWSYALLADCHDRNNGYCLIKAIDTENVLRTTFSLFQKTVDQIVQVYRIGNWIFDSKNGYLDWDRASDENDTIYSVAPETPGYFDLLRSEIGSPRRHATYLLAMAGLSYSVDDRPFQPNMVQEVAIRLLEVSKKESSVSEAIGQVRTILDGLLSNDKRNNPFAALHAMGQKDPGIGYMVNQILLLLDQIAHVVELDLNGSHLYPYRKKGKE